MSSLDVRIFMVTIFLSVILLAVSVTELLCCFKIIQDVASLAEWKFLMYYLLSEQFPSITIACFFNSSSVDDGDTLHEVERLYSSQSGGNKDSHRGKSRRAHNRAGASDRNSDYHNPAINEIYQEQYESEDSEYGSFNPNLYNHKRTTSEALDRSGANLNNQSSRMKLTDQSSSWSQSLLNHSASQAAKREAVQAANSRQL